MARKIGGVTISQMLSDRRRRDFEEMGAAKLRYLIQDQGRTPDWRAEAASWLAERDAEERAASEASQSLQSRIALKAYRVAMIAAIAAIVAVILTIISIVISYLAWTRPTD